MGKRRNTIVIGCLCALACETIYGISYVFTKKVTTTASALSLLGWRFLIAFLVMTVLVVFGFLKINLKGKKAKPLLLAALFSPILYFIGETFGISNTTATESGVFLACIPVASLMASTIILKKKPTKLQIIGILITVVGVIVTVVAVGMTYSLSIVGYGFLILSVLSYALYAVYTDKASAFTGVEITYVMVAAGAIVFVSLALIEAVVNKNINQVVSLPFNDKHFLAAVLFQGIACSIMAFFFSVTAIAKIGVNRTSSFIGWATVVSIIVGAFYLNEPFTIAQFVGAALIIAGVIIANAKK